tara:strand:- start:42 stop:986 length:945 start_codon:yes stop_codon:yes gene_type:complete
LIGAGNIGGELASLIASKSLGDVVLVDVVDGLAKGKALDLGQSGAVRNFIYSISGGSSLSKIKNSDVIVVTAGISRKPGMSRDDLISTNLEIMKNIGQAIKIYSPNSFIVCVTNPLDAMAWVLKKISGIKKNMIVGMAGILDSARFKFFLSKALNVSQEDIQTMVLGGHGDTMVPLLNYTKISGIPILEYLKQNNVKRKIVDDIIERTRNGGGEVVSLLKTGSAFYAPAISACEIVESFLRNKKKLVPCSTYLTGEYGVKNLFVGVPVVIGNKGIEKVVKVEFSTEEKNQFKKSVKSVDILTNLCQKLLIKSNF